MRLAPGLAVCARALYNRSPRTEDIPMTDEKNSTSFALVLGAVVILLPLLYIVSGQFLGRVNNRVPAADAAPAGPSHVVDALARMIERDVKSGFCPSAVFWPGHIRYDVCGFQEGEQQVWQRLAMQLSDHLTREGPTSERDPDLNVVLADLNRPNTWSLLFASNNTASLLKAAVSHLDSYNARLKQGKAGYYPRIDNLSSFLGDLTSVLGGESRHLADTAAATGLYSMRGRAAYFHTLGAMEATCVALQAAGSDFNDVLKSQSATPIFDQAMEKTCEKLGKNPGVVVNADDLSHLLTLAGSAASAVNDLTSLQTAIAAASHGGH
jgi:hypothetical protein